MATYTSIEIIYDRDHGTQNEGWYVRDCAVGEQETDTQISEDWYDDPDVPESTILSWAMTFYADPDGMTDAELQDLRDVITVKR